MFILFTVGNRRPNDAHGLSHAPDTVDEGTTLPPEETNEAEGKADKMQPVGFEVTVTDKSSQTLES